MLPQPFLHSPSPLELVHNCCSYLSWQFEKLTRDLPSAAVLRCCRGAAQSASRFPVLFVGAAGVCHWASNICPLLTQAQHHFRVNKTVYSSLETNYQVRTVKLHIVLITPALLPWHMFYCPRCLQESMGLPLLATSAQVCLCCKEKVLPFQKYPQQTHLLSLFILYHWENYLCAPNSNTS